MRARRNAKLERRKEALPAFKTAHDIDGTDSSLDHLLDMGYMSPEDDNPGAVDVAVWQAKADKRSSQGQKVWEVIILQWRVPKVSNCQHKSIVPNLFDSLPHFTTLSTRYILF